MIADHKGEIPFVVLLLPFLAGIGLGIYYRWGSLSLSFADLRQAIVKG